MSAKEYAKRLFPLVTVVSSGRKVADEVRAPRGDADLVTRLHAMANAVLVVTGTILVIRELRRGSST
ncbi:MAG: hypothetical protein GEV09_08290 [Pseudonocardiaceae bacterium]|nr:hypothetical protein [Pseudonocardiaceae bacterium]